MNTQTNTLPNSQGLSFQNLAKKAVFKQLENLKVGQFVINDGGVRHVFGEGPGGNIVGELNIVDRACYVDILTGGSIGAAESYMTGDWTSPDLAALMRLMVRNMDVLDGMEGGLAKLSKPVLKVMHRLNQNTVKGSKRNIAAHYDLGLVAPTEPGPQPGNPGGEVAIWTSVDQGQTWRKERQLTADSEYNHSFVRRPVNAHSDFFAFWADGHGRQPSPSRLYFCNRQGEVKRMPTSMDGAEQVPEVVDQP